MPRKATGIAALVLAAALMVPAGGPQAAGPEVSDALLYDDALALIAERFPEFAGMHVDEAAGKVYIQLTDVSNAAVEQIHSLLTLAFGQSLAKLRPEVEPARYSFTDLMRWKVIVGELAFARPSVVFVDLDELENKIVVGLSDVDSDAEPLRKDFLTQGLCV